MGSNTIGPHFLDNLLNYVYQVSSDGAMTVSPSGVISAVCQMDPKNFPYDCQSCTLQMNYGEISDNYIKLEISSYHDKTYVTHESKIWSVLSTSLKIPDSNADTVFYFEIVMRRKPNYYLVIIVFPSILLSCVTLAVYYIPVEEGERIGCGMTILLAFTVFLSEMAAHLPGNSETMPIIGLYFMMIMASSALVIIDAIIMANRTPVCPINDDEEDEGKTAVKHSGLIGVRKKLCRLNAWSCCHYILGGVCFLIIAVAHILLFAKSLSVSCDSEDS
ncbi:acetylcholine receptor subunit beta-type unc-29-like [Pecten maximus]|uniref:acetylcholine receptor subunit beta-type unc-29-like n=1 Tax=Pecten maximus TaxID=6579 RepID=UPI001458D710|nr:acetylcholine receptor subunit beta-type unc-29-like [Pecten maximus]